MNRTNVPSQLIDALTLSANFPKTFPSAASVGKITNLAGDASSRRYLRIESQKNVFVLQCAEVFDERSIKSHPFLAARELLERIGIPVPKLIEISSKLGWILLEDLGDETLQNYPSLELYKSAVDLIVKWTTLATRQNVDLIQDSKDAPHFEWAFDFEKLNFEMQFTAEHLVSKRLGLSPSDFLAATKSNSEYLAYSPRFFCHRDYHCRNLMVKSKKLYVIDFQDARMGPISYDIVSLVWDPYVRMSDSWRKELLTYWENSLLEVANKTSLTRILQYVGPKAKHPRFHEEILRMRVQRMLKAAGSYASFFNLKGRTDYLPSITPALTEALNACTELVAINASNEPLKKIVKTYSEANDRLLTP